MRYQLMNLDLGSNPSWREFDVGPYKIALVSNYDELQADLSSLGKQTRTLHIVDGQCVERTLDTNAKAGRNSITATVECPNEPEAILMNGCEKGIWDLCLILSYLSGRNVFCPEDERRYQHIVHGFEVVRSFQLPKAAGIAWSNREHFSSEKEKRPLWYFLHLNSSSDADVKALLGCVSLEIIQMVETVEDPLPTGLKSLIARLIKEIEESEITDKNLKGDLKSAVGRWGPKNAHEKFKNLLAKYELVECNLNGTPAKRVKCIWEMRNRFAHEGEFADPKWIDDVGRKREVQIYIAARIIPALVMEYLNRKFGLMQLDRVQRNSGIIKEYIYKGTHEGMQIDGI